MWQRLILALGLLAVAGAGLYLNWPAILTWTAETQRAFQNTMASGLRAAQNGDPRALASLSLATFSYGLVHAAGPGHGKILLGATAVASAATWRRMVVLSLVSGLAQALSAILLVVALVSGLKILSGSDAVDLAEAWLRPLSYGLFVAIGGVIVWRGVRILLPSAPQGHDPTHDHPHDHPHDHSQCGHAHGPSVSDIEALKTWRDSVALVVSIAIRPCTGALFLLVIAARLEILWVGIVATFAMGLGTAVFNAGVATSGVFARRLAQSGDSRTLQMSAGLLHVTGGALIVVLSLAFLLPTL
ncbi:MULTISPECIES: nickel/cobalt transporter [unclassified Marinovum]